MISSQKSKQRWQFCSISQWPLRIASVIIFLAESSCPCPMASCRYSCIFIRAIVSIWLQGSDPMDNRQIRGTLQSASSVPVRASKSRTGLSKKPGPRELVIYFLACESVLSGQNDLISRSFLKTSSPASNPHGNTSSSGASVSHHAFHSFSFETI